MPVRNADLGLLESVAREAGDIARRYVLGENKHHNKADGSPVSEADLAVNAFLAEKLRAARPDYGWLSEESVDDKARLSAKRLFVVDPIDGTSALIARKPEFTICIGVVEDHASLAGVVYNPLTDECFLAAKGCGATRNGAAIRVSAKAGLEGARVLIGPGVTKRKNWQENPWPAMHEEERCSSAYRLALVAAGQFDAVISLSGKCDWDLAAADIIVREAGGQVATRNGDAPRYNRESVRIPSVLAASPALMTEILVRTAKQKPNASGGPV